MNIENIFFKHTTQYNDVLNAYDAISYISDEKMFPSTQDTKNIYLDKLNEPSYGNIDFRSLKSNNLSSIVANKLVDRIDNLPELKANCIDAISDATQTIIKNIPLFVPNKACTIDPAKWFLLQSAESNNHIIFGKTVAIDIDENILFEKLGLKDNKTRSKKLAIVVSYHDAIRSKNNSEIRKATDALKNEWYKELYPKYKDLHISSSHTIYWVPLYFEMLPVHNNFFSTIPIDDWIFYPYWGIMRHNFSRTQPDRIFNFGPPMKCLKHTPFPGKILCTIGTYLEYKTSVFGTITISRNNKTY
jgi:hypothetical protein